MNSYSNIKCPKCESTNYQLINESSIKEGKLELRECHKCVRRYKVKVVAGFEKLIG